MRVKQEQFEALIEREGVADFIWTRTWTDIKGTEIGIFEMANDRYGVIFKISPPYYASDATQEKLENFYKINLPAESSIQIFSFASKNIENFKAQYVNAHSNPSNVGNEEILKELTTNRVEWFDKYTKESIFADKGQDVRLRNFVNLVCITIPKQNKDSQDYSHSEVVNIFSKVQISLNDFRPQKFTQKEYVSLMRELLVPDEETLSIDEDKLTYLNTQVVNNNSVLVIEEETDSLGIGTHISKKEFNELLKKDDMYDEDYDEELDEDKLSLIDRIMKSLFEKKKKENKDADRTRYTKYHAKVLTTKMFPSNMTLSKLLSNFVDPYGNSIETEVPCQFFASLTIHIKDTEATKNAVFAKTQWDLNQTSSLQNVARYFPEFKKRGEEAEIVNKKLSDGEVPFSAMWSLVLLDSSLKSVTQYSDRVQKNFMSQNWILQEENIIQHWIYLYSLPLQFEPFILSKSNRMNTLFSANCSAITPIMTGEHGFGEPVLVYVDRSGQLSGFDIFSSSTNFNFLVIGSTGSGKSYMMADFFSNYLMTGAKIRVIDVGYSYQELCQVLNGQYIEFSEEADMCLNFFTNVKLANDGKIHEDELQTFIPLVGLMAMQSLNSEDSNNGLEIPVISGFISKAITMAFEDRKRSAGMQDVLIALEKIQNETKASSGDGDIILQNLTTALYAFGDERGEYFKYFNGDNNLNFNNDFVVVELERIDSNAHLKSVVLASIATTISTEFFLDSREQRKILCIDEAWSLMDNKIVVRFLETMARRIRKHNGALGIITQNISDFQKNEATKAIFSSTANKFFLKQLPEDIDQAVSSGKLSLDTSSAILMKSVKSKAPLFSELMIKQDSGSYFVARLMTDKLAHWIYTNHQSDMAKIYQDIRHFSFIDKETNTLMGISKLDAKLIRGYSQKNNSTIEEEYSLRLRKGLLEFTELKNGGL